MLNKLFSNTSEKDICPNCGKDCLVTDILCPNCGKNLDDLFEQLPLENKKDNFQKAVLLKSLAFVITFFIAVLVVTDGHAIYMPFLATFLFPSGLIAVFIQDFNNLPGWWSIFTGWIIYITISSVGIFVKKRYVFIVIYLIFVLLLITNIAGCNALLHSPNIAKQLN